MCRTVRAFSSDPVTAHVHLTEFDFSFMKKVIVTKQFLIQSTEKNAIALLFAHSYGIKEIDLEVNSLP